MILSLLTSYLLDPFAWCLYLLIAALVLHHYKREKAAITIIACTAVFMVALMVVPFDQFLIRPLENRYSRPAIMPAHIDGIVVLSGGINPAIFATRGASAQTVTTERFIAGLAVVRRYPGAKLVFSGVMPGPPRRQARERAAFWSLVDALGVPRNRIVYEDQSTTTAENLIRCRQLLHPKRGETWLLVTSALHIPRAMATARHVGWDMTPWPSDYMSTPSPGSGLSLSRPSQKLVPIDWALHEWVGLIVYRLRGWAD